MNRNTYGGDLIYRENTIFVSKKRLEISPGLLKNIYWCDWNVLSTC